MEVAARRAKRVVEGFWQVEVKVWDDGSGRAWSICIFAGETLAEALARGFKEGTYYLARYARVELVGIERCCKACSGQGETWAPGKAGRLGVRRPCKACKGNPVLETFPAIPLAVHDNVIVTDRPVVERTDGPVIA